MDAGRWVQHSGHLCQLEVHLVRVRIRLKSKFNNRNFGKVNLLFFASRATKLERKSTNVRRRRFSRSSNDWKRRRRRRRRLSRAGDKSNSVDYTTSRKRVGSL